MNNTTNGEGAEWEIIDERIRFGFYIIFLVIGSVGNVMLIGIIARKKSSKTVFELFILNLAVSDLLLILLYIGPSVYSFIAEFSASLFYCKFLWPISTFAFLLEIFSMTSMAIHRLWLIVYYQKPKPKKRAACVSIVALWVTAFVVTLPLIVVSQVTNVVPPANCHEDWPSVSHRRAYTVVLLLLQYIIPLVLIGSAYARIATFLYIRPRGSTSALAPEGRRNSAGRASRRDNIQVSDKSDDDNDNDNDNGNNNNNKDNDNLIRSLVLKTFVINVNAYLRGYNK